MKRIKQLIADILLLSFLFAYFLFLCYLISLALCKLQGLGNASLYQSWIGPSPTAVGIVIFLYAAWRIWDHLNDVEQERKAGRDRDLAYCPHLVQSVALCRKGGDVNQCAGRLRDCPLQIER